MKDHKVEHQDRLKSVRMYDFMETKTSGRAKKWLKEKPYALKKSVK